MKKVSINKDWTSACQAYSDLTDMPYDKAVQVSLLLWINRDIGEAPLTRDYRTFEAMLEGKKPYPGAWVKSADRKKVKGTPRATNDPTCYSFEEFWMDYGYKTGKPGSSEIWALYDEPTRARIKAHIPGYKLKTTVSKEKTAFGDFKPARAMPQSYLRDQLMKYWKGDFEPVVEETVPQDAKYKTEYAAHLAKWFVKYPSLKGSLLYLCYEDFEAIRDGDYSKISLPAIGPGVRDRSMEMAYLVAAESSKKVIDTFKNLCANAPV